MPYVQVRVSVSLTKEQIEKLAAETLNSIVLIPGKSAPVTMAEIVPDCNLYFGAVQILSYTAQKVYKILNVCSIH